MFHYKSRHLYQIEKSTIDQLQQRKSIKDFTITESCCADVCVSTKNSINVKHFLYLNTNTFVWLFVTCNQRVQEQYLLHIGEIA